MNMLVLTLIIFSSSLCRGLENTIENQILDRVEFSTSKENTTQLTQTDEITTINNFILLFSSMEKEKSNDSFVKYTEYQMSLIHTKGFIRFTFFDDKTYLLASGSGDQSFVIWDNNYNPIQVINNAHDDAIWSLIVLNDDAGYSNRGNLVTGSWDKAIKLWDKSNEFICLKIIINAHDGPVNSFVVLNDGNLLSASEDLTIKVWRTNPLDLNCLSIKTRAHFNPINAFALLSNQNGETYKTSLIASCSSDRSIKLWQITTSSTETYSFKQIELIENAHNDDITSLVALYDGSLASASLDNSIKIWIISEQENIDSICKQTISNAHNQYVYSLASILSTNNKNFLASASSDLTIKLWSLAGNNLNILNSMTHHTETNSIIYLKNSNIALTKTIKIKSNLFEYSIVILNSRTINLSLIKQFGINNDYKYLTLIELYDEMLASSDTNHSIKIWNMTSFNLLRSINNAHNQIIDILVVLQDARIVSASSKELKIKIWDIQSFSLYPKTIFTLYNYINFMKVLNNGKIVSTENNSLKIYDQNSHILINKIDNAHSKYITCLLIINSNGYLVSGSADQSIKIWNPLSKNFNLIKMIQFSSIPIVISEYENQGYYIAFGFSDGSISIWIKNNLKNDLVSFATLLNTNIDVSLAGLGLVFISSDTFVTLSSNIIQIWAISSNQYESITIKAHNDAIISICVSLNDSSILFSGSNDKSIKVLKIKQDIPKSNYSNVFIKDLSYQTLNNSLSNSGISSLVLFSNGNIVCGRDDGSIELWQQNNTLLYAFKSVHTMKVFYIIELNNQNVLSASFDNSIILWSLSFNNISLITLFSSFLQYGLSSLIFSADLLYAGGSDGTIAIFYFNLETKSFYINASISAHNDLITSLCLLSNGNLVSGSKSEIKIWSVSRNENEEIILQEIWKIKPEDGYLNGFVNVLLDFEGLFDSEGYNFISGNEDGSLILLNLNDSNYKAISSINSVSLVKSLLKINDSILAVGLSNGQINIWYPNQFITLLNKIQNDDYIISLAFLSNGCLASSDSSYTIIIWNKIYKNDIINLEKQIVISTGGFTKLISLNKANLLMGFTRYTIKIWDLNKTKVSSLIAYYNINIRDNILTVTALDNFNKIALGFESGLIQILKLNATIYSIIYNNSNAHDFGVLSLGVLFTESGKPSLLASGDQKGFIKIWNAKNEYEKIKIIENAHQSDITSLCFLHDYNLASSSKDSSIKIWNTNNNFSLLFVINEAHFSFVDQISVLLDGSLVSIGGDGFTKIWNKNNNYTRVIRVIFSYETDVYKGFNFAFSINQDGTLLASSINAKSINIFNISSQFYFDPILTLTGHKNNITSLAILPNQNLISGSSDSTIKLWDINTKDYAINNSLNNLNKTLESSGFIFNISESSLNNDNTYLVSYFTVDDAYLINSEINSLINGWNNGTFTNQNIQKVNDENKCYLTRKENDLAYIEWHFDINQMNKKLINSIEILFDTAVFQKSKIETNLIINNKVNDKIKLKANQNNSLLIALAKNKYFLTFPYLFQLNSLIIRTDMYYGDWNSTQLFSVYLTDKTVSLFQVSMFFYTPINYYINEASLNNNEYSLYYYTAQNTYYYSNGSTQSAIKGLNNGCFRYSNIKYATNQNKNCYLTGTGANNSYIEWLFKIDLFMNKMIDHIEIKSDSSNQTITSLVFNDKINDQLILKKNNTNSIANCTFKSNNIFYITLQEKFQLKSLRIKININDKNYQLFNVQLNQSNISLFYVSFYFVTNTSTIPPTVTPIVNNLIDLTMNYRGCYIDNTNTPDLNGPSFSNESVSIESCIYYCILNKYSFAALQSGNLCLCGAKYGTYGQIDDNDCNNPCIGNQNEMCGSILKNSVYSTKLDKCDFYRLEYKVTQNKAAQQGLINYWPFSNHLCDVAGRADLYEASNASFTYDLTNLINSSISLDNGYLRIPSNAYFIGMSYTVIAWIKINTLNSETILLDFGNGAPKDNVIFVLSNNQVILPSNQVYNGINCIFNVTSKKELELNEWYHVAFVLDFSNVYIYIDAILTVTGITDSYPNNVKRTNNYVGRSNWDINNQNVAKADFDEIKIFDRVLNQEEIENDRNYCNLMRRKYFLLTNKQENLLNYWPFSNHYCDVVGGADLFDGTNAELTYDLSGSVNSALSLNDGFINLPPGIYIYGDSFYSFDFTITAWVKIRSFNFNFRLLDFAGIGQNGNGFISISLSHEDTGKPWAYGAIGPNFTATIFLYSKMQLALNEWQHFAFVGNFPDTSFYINGYRANLITTGRNGIQSAINIFANRNFIGRSNFKGAPDQDDQDANADYDEIKIFNRSLSLSEIQDDMHNMILDQYRFHN